MGIDWLSVTVSAVVSAVLSGAVSLVFARHVVQQQETGRSAAEAGRQIGALVGSELTKVRQYQGRAYGSLRREATEQVLQVGDVELCGKLLALSADLSRWRRPLVRRRLRRLFGVETVRLCAIHGGDSTTSRGAIAMILQRQAMASLHPEHRLAMPDVGQFDQALRCAPDSKEVSKLVRSLERLAKCH